MVCLRLTPAAGVHEAVEEVGGGLALAQPAALGTGMAMASAVKTPTTVEPAAATCILHSLCLHRQPQLPPRRFEGRCRPSFKLRRRALRLQHQTQKQATSTATASRVCCTAKLTATGIAVASQAMPRRMHKHTHKSMPTDTSPVPVRARARARMCMATTRDMDTVTMMLITTVTHRRRQRLRTCSSNTALEAMAILLRQLQDPRFLTLMFPHLRLWLQLDLLIRTARAAVLRIHTLRLSLLPLLHRLNHRQAGGQVWLQELASLHSPRARRPMPLRVSAGLVRSAAGSH